MWRWYSGPMAAAFSTSSSAVDGTRRGRRDSTPRRDRRNDVQSGGGHEREHVAPRRSNDPIAPVSACVLRNHGFSQCDHAILWIETVMRHGRMERVFGTLQKWLPQGLWLANIKTMAAANWFLKDQFVPDYNPRVAVPAAKPGSRLRALCRPGA